MKLSVPYYSQHVDVTDPDWRGKACTVINLKMLLDYYSSVWENTGIDSPSLDEIVSEGVRIGGYQKGVGWIHDHIAILARNHGLHAYKQEFRSFSKKLEDRLTEEGIEKIKKYLEKESPVIVSITKGNGSFHTVLIVGIENDKFIYHEPDVKERSEGAYQEMSIEQFKKVWRKFAIFVYP